MQAIGYNVAGACYVDPKTETLFPKNDYVEWQGIPVFRLAVRSLQDIKNFIHKTKPDLVITQSFDAPEIVRFSKEIGAKTIIGVHFWRNICDVPDNFSNMLNRPLESVRLLTRKHRVFFEADAVFANSEFMKRALLRYTGFDCQDIINPIIDMDRILAKNKTQKYITIINPDIGKGGKLFLSLAERMKDTQFLCVGIGNESSPENKQLNSLIRGTPNVKMIENTDNMSEIYGDTKILLVPSLVDETFSMVALEGMMNGIPVIASTAGNLPYLVKGGGFVLNPTDIDIWEGTIRSLLSDDDFYKEVSSSAIIDSQEYSPEKCFEKLLNILNRIGVQ